MNLDAVRITLRLNRFELFAFGAFLVAFSAMTVGAAMWIDSLRPSAECLAGSDTLVAGCQARLNEWESANYGFAAVSVGVLTFVAHATGLFLGVPIVAREVERGTTRLAWSLAPSRTRWYLARVIPIGVFVAVLGFVAGTAIDRYLVATQPDLDLGNSFVQFGLRGGLIASRALFIFAIAVAVGAIVPRALPALILGAIVAGIGLIGGERVHQMFLQREAVVVPMDMQTGEGGAGPGDLYIDQKFILPDGSLADWQDLNNLGQEAWDEQGNPRYPIVVLMIPGERLRFVEAREAGALGGASLVALVLAGFVVQRRRPG